MEWHSTPPTVSSAAKVKVTVSLTDTHTHTSHSPLPQLALEQVQVPIHAPVEISINQYDGRFGAGPDAVGRPTSDDRSYKSLQIESEIGNMEPRLLQLTEFA